MKSVIEYEVTGNTVGKICLYVFNLKKINVPIFTLELLSFNRG